jgi:hypothetical protein
MTTEQKEKIEKDVRSKAKKKLISVNADYLLLSKKTFSSFDSLFRDKNFNQCKKLLNDVFNNFANKHNCSLEEIVCQKPFGFGSELHQKRLQTDEEFEKEIKDEIKCAVRDIQINEKRTQNRQLLLLLNL